MHKYTPFLYGLTVSMYHVGPSCSIIIGLSLKLQELILASMLESYVPLDFGFSFRNYTGHLWCNIGTSVSVDDSPVIPRENRRPGSLPSVLRRFYVAFKTDGRRFSVCRPMPLPRLYPGENVACRGKTSSRRYFDSEKDGA
jgi:hypothetical protein